jgi:hypothetical protein
MIWMDVVLEGEVVDAEGVSRFLLPVFIDVSMFPDLKRCQAYGRRWSRSGGHCDFVVSGTDQRKKCLTQC